MLPRPHRQAGRFREYPEGLPGRRMAAPGVPVSHIEGILVSPRDEDAGNGPLAGRSPYRSRRAGNDAPMDARGRRGARPGLPRPRVLHTCSKRSSFHFQGHPLEGALPLFHPRSRPLPRHRHRPSRSRAIPRSDREDCSPCPSPPRTRPMAVPGPGTPIRASGSRRTSGANPHCGPSSGSALRRAPRYSRNPSGRPHGAPWSRSGRT